MAARDFVFKIIGVPIVVLLVMIVGWIGVRLTDAMFLGFNGPPSSLGWTDGRIVLEFMGIALSSLAIVTILWLFASPIIEDVRQDQRKRRGPF